MTDYPKHFANGPTKLEHILYVSRKMAEIRQLAPLLNYVMAEAMGIIDAERGFVVLVRSDGSLDFKVKRDHHGHEIEDAHDQISTSILKRVVETREPLILRNAVDDPQFGQADSVVLLQLRSIMCVPLISRGETIGAIYVENRTLRNRFKKEDLGPLIVFANQAAVAIENAALNDKLEARVAARTHELEEARDRLEQSWQEAVKANRLRTVWLSQIAHDLRAPLGIATGALSLIQERTLGNINAEQEEWISKAIRSIKLAVQLTEDIFDLSRVDEGHLRLHLVPLNLQILLETVNDAATGLAWPEQVEFSLKIQHPLPELYLDPIRIKQVLFNLLTNAQKYTSAGSVTLEAQHLPAERTVHIRVKDTGEGIAPEHIDRLFNRFSRLNRKSHPERSGTGLGLAICRELVEMHNGKIWVESTPQVGTTFTFSLPTDLTPESVPSRVDVY